MTPIPDSGVSIKETHEEVTLVWKDGGRTQALVSRLGPEVTCGEHRFKQNPKYPTIYNEF